MLINTFSVFFNHIRIASVLISRNKKSPKSRERFDLTRRLVITLDFHLMRLKVSNETLRDRRSFVFILLWIFAFAYLHFVFSQGWVERAKNERAWKSTCARKGDTRLGDFHARSPFARSTIPEEKWGTTRSLNNSPLLDGSNRKSANSFVDQNKKAFVILVPMTSIARNIGRKKKRQPVRSPEEVSSAQLFS